MCFKELKHGIKHDQNISQDIMVVRVLCVFKDELIIFGSDFTKEMLFENNLNMFING